MDFNSLRTVDFYPYEEVEKLMKALEVAEPKDDLAALKYCARKLLLLYYLAGTSEGCLTPDQLERLFIKAYRNPDDLPPQSIEKIVA